MHRPIWRSVERAAQMHRPDFSWDYCKRKLVPAAMLPRNSDDVKLKSFAERLDRLCGHSDCIATNHVSLL